MSKLSEQELLEKYESEYSDWFTILEKYHENRFKNNYLQYTVYTQTEGTTAKVSDPVAPELVERVVQRFFERDPKFFVIARGKNVPKEITDIMSSVAEYYWTNPDMVQISGTSRSRLKVLGREFCILGNSGTESFYNSKTETPDFRIIPIEDVIFDPSKTLKTSPVYYVRQYVSLDYLKDNQEIDKNGKKYGIFQNISTVEDLLKDTKKTKPDVSKNRVNRSGSDLYDKSVDQIELVTRWEGNKCCRYIRNLGKEKPNVLIQEFENNVLGEDPLDFAMDIEVPKQPYAFGILDFLNGITHSKDLILNQLIDYNSKVLNPPLFVDPDIASINKASLANAWRLGGLVFASPKSATHLPMPPLGNAGFDMLGYLQQRSESVSGVGSYIGGVPNQVSDKTRGTAAGIQALIQQAQPPIKDRQQNIEESIIEPIVNKWLKMAGALMSDNEIKYVFISGQSPKWVGLTKGFLSGKIKIEDLVVAELMTPDEAMEAMGLMTAEGQDPNKDFVFDVDWIMRVETGSMAEADKADELRNFDETTMMGLKLGIPLDLKKRWVERAMKAGEKEPEQYILQPQAGMPMNGGMNGPQQSGGIGTPDQTLQVPQPTGGIPIMAGLGGQAGIRPNQIG